MELNRTSFDHEKGLSKNKSFNQARKVYERMVVTTEKWNFCAIPRNLWNKTKALQYLVQLRVIEIEFSLNLQVSLIKCNYVKED